MSDSPPQKPAWTSVEISLLVGSVLLITFAAFEGLATMTIMPNVVEDLGAESWFSVASGSTLAAELCATVVAGALADSRGPERVLVVGVVLFSAGLLLTAFAPHIGVFVLGRLILGIGGGFVIVPLYVLIGAVAAPIHHPTYFAAFSLAWVLPSLVGPAVAGIVTIHFGWRPVFGAVPVFVLFAYAPLRSALTGFDEVGHPASASVRRLGVLALAAGTGVLALQLSGAARGLALVVSALVGLGATCWAMPKLLPKGALRFAPGAPAAIMTRLLAMGAQSGAGAFVPLLLQRVHQWKADAASLAVTVGTLGWALGAVLQSRVRTERGRTRLPVFGTAILTLGIAPTTLLLMTDIPVWPILTAWFFACLGMGLTHSALSVLSLSLAPQREHGKVSSWLLVADAGGAAIELALVSILLALWSYTGPTGAATYLPAPLIALVVAGLGFAAALRIHADSPDGRR